MGSGRKTGDTSAGLGGVLVLAGAPRAADRGRLAWDRVPSAQGPAPPARPSQASGLQAGRRWRSAAAAAFVSGHGQLSHTVQAHPVGPTPTPRLLRAWALPGPGEHCHTPSPNVSKGCRAHGNAPSSPSAGAPLKQPPSDFPFLLQSRLNGILDNQSMRPSA